MTAFPDSVLQTEAAIRLGLLVHRAGYELDVTPRPNGADLAARRHGTTWATFHVDVDRERPLFLRVGATVWGGARKDANVRLVWDATPEPGLDAFARDRLALACKVGRREDPDHCASCPEALHREP